MGKAPDEISYARATAEDVEAVVELCMQVEEQHEKYWELRWKRRQGLREGYTWWLGKRLGEKRMLIDESGKVRVHHFEGLDDATRYLEADFAAIREAGAGR